MTNDERNPKPECRKTLSGAFAGFVIRISSFVIRICEEWFMESPLSFFECIGTMNLKMRNLFISKQRILRFIERENIGVRAPRALPGANIGATNVIAFMPSSIKLRSVKTIPVAVIGLFLASAAMAQGQLPQPDEIIQSVQEWIEDNLDEKALDELGVDKDRVQQFLTELRRRFQGTYVYDLGALRETATSVLPVLQQFEETRPLAVWLQTRLDYFDVAEQLRREAKPAPEKVPPSRLPNPAPQIE